MPYIETVDELADAIADLLGVYGAHSEGEQQECRVCFVSDMSQRIRQAVENDKHCEAMTQSKAEKDAAELLRSLRLWLREEPRDLAERNGAISADQTAVAAALAERDAEIERLKLICEGRTSSWALKVQRELADLRAKLAEAEARLVGKKTEKDGE